MVQECCCLDDEVLYSSICKKRLSGVIYEKSSSIGVVGSQFDGRSIMGFTFSAFSKTAEMLDKA